MYSAESRASGHSTKLPPLRTLYEGESYHRQSPEHNLNVLAPDHWPPIGVMAFWPFSRGFYITGLEWFLPIGREWQLPATIALDARAAFRELLILVPIVALVWWVRTRRRRSRDRSFDRAAPH